MIKSKKAGYDDGSKPWKQPSGEMFYLACCDCGLVHETTLTIKGKKVKVKYVRNDDKTRKLRKTK